MRKQRPERGTTVLRIYIAMYARFAFAHARKGEFEQREFCSQYLRGLLQAGAILGVISLHTTAAILDHIDRLAAEWREKALVTA